MKNIYIRNHKNQTVIYQGAFRTMRQAVEAAIHDNVSLSYANLRGARLGNAALDGGDFRYSILENANMIGANLSEADFTGANMRGADLSLACLCESRMVDTDFTNTFFGVNLLTGAVIDNCVFTCPSALTLPFIEALAGRNIFSHEGKVVTFTGAPVLISGLPKRVALFDTYILIGNTLYARQRTPVDIKTELERLCGGTG